MITLYSSYNSIYIILSYILCYYGLLTSFNVISIFFVTKYFKSQNINIKESNEREFQLSEEVLRFLSIISLGILALWIPLMIIMSSKQYYYFDDIGNKISFDINYKYTHVFGSLIIYSIIFPLRITESTKQVNDFLSNKNLAEMRLSTYLLQHGYFKLFTAILKDYTTNLTLGLIAGSSSCLFQYLMLYSIDLKLSVNIDWTYLISSMLLKSVGYSLGFTTILKFKLMFLFDPQIKYLILLGTLICLIVSHTGCFMGEKALIFSLDGINNISCSDHSINASVLAAIAILAERSLTFLIYYTFSIPSTLSWNNLHEIKMKLKDYRNKLVSAENKSKHLFSKLLKENVPPRIAKTLMEGEVVAPEKYQLVVMFFSDIKGFTSIADNHDPLLFFESIDRVFSIMDCCVSQFQELYKVETSGDSYNVVGIVDDPDNPESVDKTVNALINFTFLVRRAVQLIPRDDAKFVEIRIGLHLGDCVAGVSGKLTPKYSFFGATVDVARKIEKSGITNRIHVSPAFASIVKHLPGSCDAFVLEKREDMINIKGVDIQTYWLENSDIVDIDTMYYETFQFMQKYIAEYTVVQPELLEIMHADDAMHSTIDRNTFPVFNVSSLDALTELIGSSSSPNTSFSSVTSLGDFTDIFTFEYEIFEVNLDDYVGISHYNMGIFDRLFDLNSICVDRRVISNFIRRISRSYRQIPYHNYFHSFCVVQFTAALLVQCNLQKKLPQKELFCLLICALIHDVDHPGTNNSFEVATQSRLSILYNDISVLENHHIALGFSIINSSNDYNVISKWSTEEKRHFRESAIHNILATDMAIHNDLVKEITCRALNPKPFDITQRDERRALYRILLHSADLSNTVRPFHINQRICSLIADEFRTQARKEKEHGIAVTPHMVLPDEIAIAKGEIGFLQFVAKPYFRPQSICFDAASILIQRLDDNIENWTRIKKDLEEMKSD